MTNTPVLYMVSTPIGNLADITFRAIEILKSVDLIICEDTRHSQILLNHYGIQKPLMSLFQGKEKAKTEKILPRLETVGSAALISDAGTPNLSDPGFPLVRECLKRGIDVVPVPGPSALLAALAASGLPTHSFVFEGFLPVKKGERSKKILSWKDESRTVVFYESCHRIARTLVEMHELLGDVPVVVARELTKKFEEFLRLGLKQAAEHFEKHEPRGEFVVLINLKN